MTTRRHALPLLLLVLGSLVILLTAAPSANAAGQFRCFFASDGAAYRCSAPAAEFPAMSTRAWTRSPAATLDSGYPTFNEPAIAGWRWSGTGWSQVWIDHATRCYRPGSNCWRAPWAGAPAWSWYWEARYGWLAVPTSQVEIEVPVSNMSWATRGACLPGRGVPIDVSAQDARVPTAYSCIFAFAR